MPHVQYMREKLEQRQLSLIRWADTRDMNSDGHTKGSIPRDAILAAMNGRVTYTQPFKDWHAKAASGNAGLVPACPTTDAATAQAGSFPPYQTTGDTTVQEHNFSAPSAACSATRSQASQCNSQVFLALSPAAAAAAHTVADFPEKGSVRGDFPRRRAR